MIKVAIIGCGGMGHAHAPHLVKLPNVKVVATCDQIAEKAKALAEQHGIARHCTDYHELIPQVDAAWICTTPFNRVEMVTAFAKAGKHIFTEKPIAHTLADADKMLAVTAKAKVKYMIGYSMKYWPMPFGIMQYAFAKGELGDLVSCWTRRLMPNRPQSWYAEQDKSGGVMLDFGSHDVDWLRWIGGEVQTVFGKTFRVHEGITADEHGGAMFIFKNGRMATVETSWSSHLLEVTAGIIGTKGSMIMGSDNKLRKKIGYAGKEEIVEEKTATTIDPQSKLGAKEKAEEIKKLAEMNEPIQKHFFRCIEQDVEPRSSGESSRKTLLTVMAIWESSRTGKPVEVDSMAKKS